jgi:hypothetical protein
LPETHSSRENDIRSGRFFGQTKRFPSSPPTIPFVGQKICASLIHFYAVSVYGSGKRKSSAPRRMEVCRARRIGRIFSLQEAQKPWFPKERMAL